MALDAGSVTATLGGRVDMRGFNEYGAALNATTAKAAAAEKRMAEFQRRSDAAMASLGRAAKYTAIGVGVGLVGSLGFAIKKAADFEAQISSLGSVSGATGKRLEQLKQQAMDAGAATKYSALEAAQAQTELAKGGLSVQKILSGGLQGALALAAAGEMELADAATTTAQTLSQFNLGGAQATHVADALATAANQTTMDVADFAQALAQGGKAAQTAGLSFDQTMVALQALAPGFASGSDMGTSLKAMLTQLASPTDKAAEKMKELGIQVFDANGKIKPLPALAKNLKGALGDLTQQQRLQAATTLAGTDGMRALLGLYGIAPSKLREYARAVKEQGTAAEVAAQKQDNLKGKVENLGGSLETAAIKVGQQLLPMLEKGAVKATEFINELSKSGKLEGFADDVGQGIETLVAVLGDVIAVGGQVVGVIGDVVGAIDGLIDLGDPTTLEAILAAVVAFKITSSVVPGIVSLSGAISELLLNARTAPSLAAFFTSLSVGGQIGLVAAAVAGLAAGLVILGDQENIEEQAARNNADAHREQAAAIRDVAAAELEAANKGLAARADKLRAEDARIATAQARARLRALPDDAPKSEVAAVRRDIERAVNAENTAVLRARTSWQAYNAEVAVQGAKSAEAVIRQLARVGQAQAALSKYDRYIAQRESNGATNFGQNPQVIAVRTNLLRALQTQTEAYYETLSRTAVSETNRNRLMNQGGAITERNVEGVSKLVNALKGVPPKVQTKLLLQDQQALAAAGNYSAEVRRIAGQKIVTRILTDADSATGAMLAFRAIVKGVPASKVVNIVANATSKKDEVAKLKDELGKVKPPPQVDIKTTAKQRQDEIRALQNQVNNLQGKEIVITTRYETTGTPPKAAPASPVPRAAAGGRTSGPQMYLVGEGSDPVEWIIPRDPKYRARARSLLMDAAASILPGAKKGTKTGGPRATAAGKKNNEGNEQRPAKWVPKPSEFLRLSPEQFQEKSDALRQRRDRLADVATRKQNGKLTKAALEAKRKLPDVEARFRDAHKIFLKAREFATRMERHLQEAEIQSAIMRTADTRGAGGQKTYDAAKAKRKDELQTVLRWLNNAQGMAKPGSKWELDIRQNLANVRGDIRDLTLAKSAFEQKTAGKAKDKADDAKADAKQETETERDTGMTKVQREQLDLLEQDAALAALTGKGEGAGGESGFDDDVAAASTKLTFLERILGEIRPGGSRPGTPDAVTALAGQVASARSEVKSLSEQRDVKPDVSADMQAQLNQANARIAVLSQESASNAAWAQAAGGPGDIGQGGASARQAAVNIYTLHPGDPATLRAVGDAATAGMGYQGFRDTPRAALGY